MIKDNKKIKKEIFNYTVIFEPAEEGGYIAYAPVLPGCITEGDSFEEALENIKEAVVLYLEELQTNKDELIREKRNIIVTPIQVKV